MLNVDALSKVGDQEDWVVVLVAHVSEVLKIMYDILDVLNNGKGKNVNVVAIVKNVAIKIEIVKEKDVIGEIVEIEIENVNVNEVVLREKERIETGIEIVNEDVTVVEIVKEKKEVTAIEETVTVIEATVQGEIEATVQGGIVVKNVNANVIVMKDKTAMKDKTVMKDKKKGTWKMNRETEIIILIKNTNIDQLKMVKLKLKKKRMIIMLLIKEMVTLMLNKKTMTIIMNLDLVFVFFLFLFM